MITNMQQMELIRSGRQAIERAMLNAVLRSASGTDSCQVELNELRALLDNYNCLMARHQRLIFAVPTANDNTNKQVKK